MRARAQIIVEELKGVRELLCKAADPDHATQRARTPGRQSQQDRRASSPLRSRRSKARSPRSSCRSCRSAMTCAPRPRRSCARSRARLLNYQSGASPRTTSSSASSCALRAPAPSISSRCTPSAASSIAAEPAMLIVPNKEELILEARVMPQDRDQLQLGQKAVVRVHSSNQRTTPELNGTLRRIAADVSKDPNTSAPFYTVWVSIASASWRASAVQHHRWHAGGGLHRSRIAIAAQLPASAAHRPGVSGIQGALRTKAGSNSRWQMS